MNDMAAIARAACGLATGLLGWMPADFWDATPADLRLALEGRFGRAPVPLSEAELAQLRERLSDG